MEHDTEKSAGSPQGKYIFVNALCRRVRALQNGAKPMVARPVNDLTGLALEEMRQDKLIISSRQKQGDDEPDEDASAQPAEEEEAAEPEPAKKKATKKKTAAKKKE